MNIVCPPGYHAETTDAGTVSIVKDKSTSSAIIAAVLAAGAQIPRPAAAIGATAITPIIYQQAGAAIMSGLAGDYVGAITNGLPALVGIFGAVVALCTPSPKGQTDEDIHSAVSRMSGDQLFGLLSNPKLLQTALANVQSGPVRQNVAETTAANS